MIAPTHDPLFIALRAFILSIIAGVEVVQGQSNLVPMPEGQFICMTPISQRRLSTNESTYDGVDTRDVQQHTEYSIQIDCYGASSSDHATNISIMLRDFYGCEFLSPYACQPLFTSDPSQVPLINGEGNYEQRWMLTAVLQFNPTVSVTQQFADALEVDILSVPADFPPV